MSFPEQLALILIPLVLPPLVALSAALYHHLLTYVPAQKRALVEQAAHTAVTAVEQVAVVGMTGPDKKQAALHMASELLTHLHLSVPQEVLSAVIEATVYGLRQSKSAPVVASVGQK